MSTQTCNEMLLELDVHQLWEDIQSIVKEVRDLCRVISNGDVLYRRFRRFLIENPVIDPVRAAGIFIPLGRELKDFYEPLPEHLVHHGKLYQCPECRWPMNPQRREVQCDSAWCREKSSLFRWMQGRLINVVSNQELEGEVAGKRHVLRSALWKYTLLPGLLELQLAERLSRHGLDVTLWPDVDRSDLQISHGGMTLDIDAKVWVSPRALGTYLESMHPSTTRWIVIPDYQQSHVPWLRSLCPGLQIFTQRECIKELTTRANPF
ncbi:restriction endonuclease-related protein [Pseudomonas putida]|uniref:restriction endonuclease-related protein n=1 Tax=Pseudomonas putida TaxID=303 RepID=UPI003570FB7B